MSIRQMFYPKAACAAVLAAGLGGAWAFESAAGPELTIQQTPQTPAAQPSHEPEKPDASGTEPESAGTAAPAASQPPESDPQDAGSAPAAAEDGDSEAATRQSGAADASVGQGSSGKTLPAPALEQTRERVLRMQAEGGAYAPGLDTAFIELGLALREAGESEAAADAFRQALFVARANYGLYSYEQLPALRYLIEQNRALGRWEAVVDNYFLLYWIHKRQLGTEDPRLLPVIAQVAKAQAAVPMTTIESSTSEQRIHEMRNLLRHAVEIAETQYGENDPRLATSLSRLAWTNYSLAVQTGKLIHYREYQAARRGGTVFIDENLAQAFTLIELSWRRGGDALDRIEELYEAAYEEGEPWAPYALALARLHLGDWDLLFGSGNGRAEYADAYELLGETDAPETYRAQLMGEPRLLPAPTATHAETRTDPAAQGGGKQGDRVIELTFEVTRTGRTQDFELAQVPEGMEEDVETLRTYLSFQRFRPRILEGRTTESRITRRYRVTEAGDIIPLDRVKDIVDASNFPGSEAEAAPTAGTS